MILPFRRKDHSVKRDHLARVAVELFADRPVADFDCAIRAGYLALDGGSPFFEAMVAVDDMFRYLDDAHRAGLMRLRNCGRLTAYRIKRGAINGGIT